MPRYSYSLSSLYSNSEITAKVSDMLQPWFVPVSLWLQPAALTATSSRSRESKNVQPHAGNVNLAKVTAPTCGTGRLLLATAVCCWPATGVCRLSGEVCCLPGTVVCPLPATAVSSFLGTVVFCIPATTVWCLPGKEGFPLYSAYQVQLLVL